MECKYELRCLNVEKCHRCFNESMLKLKEDKQRKYKEKQYSHRIASGEDSWKDLEQTVADAINKVPTMKEARRSIMSGALWFEKGDIVDSILHPECKERTGTELKSGEKSISIKKEWLTKAADECKFNGKTMCLPFRFKQDDQIYCIFDFEDIANLITYMKAYMADNDALRAENEALRSILEKVKEQGGLV